MPERKRRRQEPECEQVVEEPSKFTPCCICARDRTITARGRETQIKLHTLSFDMVLDDRSVKIPKGLICDDCMAQLPNFIAGSIHLATNMPKEKFNRSFKLPPCILSLEKETPVKRTRRTK